ncbi:MAG: hypothetical protein LC754_05995 [Acidobacteria bacterium]|nr:hypothetical protein [Acidobacteriota bacterium]
MKVLCALLLLTSYMICAQAQSPAPAAGNPPGVSVIKFSWSKDRINWERDPFGGTVESGDEMRLRSRGEKRIEDAKSRGDKAEVERLKREAGTDAAIIAHRHRDRGPARYVFTYKASVRNDGTLAIKSIDWDYVFYDAATREELGRHQFTSEGKLNAGKSREFTFTIPTPPSRTVSAETLDSRKERASLDGRVVLMRVVYADGTIWQPPPPPNVR